MPDIDDKYPKLAQGSAKPANNTDLNHDLVSGLTYPNLHRRIDNEVPLSENPKERQGRLAPDAYDITVSTVNSYRTKKIITHLEDSEDSEIP